MALRIMARPIRRPLCSRSGDLKFEVTGERHRFRGIHGHGLTEQLRALLDPHVPRSRPARTASRRPFVGGAGGFKRAAARNEPLAAGMVQCISVSATHGRVGPLMRLGSVRLKDFQTRLVATDGQRELGNLDGQVRVIGATPRTMRSRAISASTSFLSWYAPKLT